MKASVTSTAVPRPPFGAERFLIYVMSYAGLMAVVFAAAGWLQLLGALVLHALGIESGLSDSQIRVQASYDLASTVVGLIVWLVFWRLASRRIARVPLERQALERRLFLAGVFLVTSVVVLFFVEQFVHAGFETATGGSFGSHLHDLLAPLTFIFAYGAAWFWYARLGWRERSFQAPDAAHDFALYTLLSFALGFLFYGVQDAISIAVNDISGYGQNWTGWIEPASFILTGGLVWAAASKYDQARRGRRRLRVAYLYLVLAFAVGISLQQGITIGSALLQQAFGSNSDWSFAWDQLQYFVPAVGMWACYWMLLRSQAAFVPAGPRGGVPWPRRAAIAALCLVGLLLTVSAVMQLAWTGLQAFLNSPGYDQWWVPNLSNGLSKLAVGAVLWLPAWKLLQRAARLSPKEKGAWERRWLLFTITTLSALGALSGIVVAVFFIFSHILGTGVGGNFAQDEAEALVGVLVSGAILSYYGRIFLAERRDRAAGPSQLRVSALCTPGTESIIARIQETEGVLIEVAGYVDQAAVHGGVGIDSIPDELERLRSQGVERAWLIVSSAEGAIYGYTRSAQPEPDAAPRPIMEHAAGTV